MALSSAGSLRGSLAARVRALNDLVLFGDLDDGEFKTLSAGVDRLLDPIAPDRPDRRPWWEGPEPAGVSYRHRSPVSGTENPRAPGLDIELVTDEDGLTTLIGETTASKAFAGPPGAVHGGILAALFDEAIGLLATALHPGVAVVTATLDVRYRQPTPLNRPLRFEARSMRRSSRRLRVAASCHTGDAVTAEAEALLIARP